MDNPEMPPFDSVDLQLRGAYRLPGGLPPFELELVTTALLVIDTQYLDAHPDGEFGRRAREHGIDDLIGPFFTRLAETTTPAIQALLETARHVQMNVIFTRIASITDDGRELGRRYRWWQMTPHVDALDAQFLDGLEPQRNEIVINKLATSAFIGSHLDRILRNLSIETVVVCGVMTNGCVESTVRDAADLGYSVLVAEDGCAALSEKAHRNAVNAMQLTFAAVESAEAIRDRIEAAAAVASDR